MLDKAIAVLECELNIAPDVRVQSGLIDQDWKGKRARIRAAVRDVALAINWRSREAIGHEWPIKAPRIQEIFEETKAEIVRQFGLPAGSGKGEG